MAGFQQKTIGEILTFQRGFDITKKEQTPGVVPIVSSSGISSFHSQFKVKAPGVVIGRKGTLGTVHYIKQDFWPHDTTLWVKDFKGNDPRFISYFLKTLHLENFDTGSSNPTLNRNHLHKIKIIFPGLKIQQKIAAILSAYDDLIENNKRRIALLEKMAEEIYREWFVRFRFPGWENAEFEKGIPVGWEVVRFRDVVKYYIGGGWGEEEESPNYPVGAHVIRGTDIPALNAGDYSNKVHRFHKESNYKSRKLQKNDFVFEVSGGSTNQLLGRNIMISDGLLELFKGEVLCASFCKLIRFDDEKISPFFMKYYFNLYYDCDLVGIYQVQSTGISNYQFESFLNYQTLAVPDKTTSLHFEKIVTPIIKQQEYLALENLMLTKTKEQLLPRLISGKLSVEDLDIQFPPSMQANNTEPEVA
ncbi:restriction endonuclease subunit S [Saccharophagus degradans]|uniref:restriction endonuclease subunit S n=1 Tax=Saccharophagus degradans TaxID=86304 RepID=UPI002477D110|nr:restriction endonuclease subunit S [Saccharophagus degradans]WGO97059.1 restriction endonuclease subunit S [Saccharophagus degradans]